MGAGSTAVFAVFALLPITRASSALPEYPIDGTEMKVRAEYYTEGGKYLGGMPEYVNKFQFFECTRFASESTNSSTATSNTTTDGSTTTTDDITTTTTTTTDGAQGNATVCTSWTVNEVGSDLNDVGRCSCQSVANTGYYCKEWTCSRLGAESTQCTCEEEDAGSEKFCSSWTCLETDPDGTQEVGEYTCVTASSTSSPEFCEAWTGVIEGSGEVEVSSCACAEQLDGVGICSCWECKERGMAKCSRANSSWCNIAMSVGVGGFVGSWGAMLVAFGVYISDKRCRHRVDYFDLCYVLLIGFLSMAGMSVAVLVWGGQDGAVYSGIWWGAIIAGSLLWRCLPGHQS